MLLKNALTIECPEFFVVAIETYADLQSTKYFLPGLPCGLAEPGEALREAGELCLLLDDSSHPHHLPPAALLDHEDAVQPESEGGVHPRGQGEAPELLHLGEQRDHPGVLPQAVDHQLVHPGGAGWQPRDREVVGARDFLAWILSRQRGLGLLPFLLQGPELLIALLQPKVELHCGPGPWLHQPGDGRREHGGQEGEGRAEEGGGPRGNKFLFLVNILSLPKGV